MREQNIFARDARRRYLAHERKRTRQVGASSSHGAPPPLPRMAMLPSPLEHIPSTIQERYIAEFQNSTAFKREMLDVTAAVFIQSFDDCKIRLQTIMPYLELHGIEVGSTDEEVEASTNED